MANFETALKPTLKDEGGWANNPHDTGGETYRGISRKNFPKWNGWLILDAHKPIKAGQLIIDSALDVLIALFYRTNFWNPLRGGEIINQEVANDLFNKAVVMGIHQAVVLCQRSLEINESGKMDNTTLNTLNEMNPYA